MRSVLFQAICKAGIFMICAQTIVHFRPQEAYEKYLKLLVSVMILIQLFLPLGSFLFGGGSEEVARKLEVFREELEYELSISAQRSEELDAVLEQMTLEEVRKRMEEEKAAEGEAEKGEAGEIEISVEVEPVILESDD